MATSGSVDYTVTRDEIITEALELLGVLEPGTTADANDVTSAARTLNMMIKAWQIDGVDVFSIKRAFMFLEKEKTDYSLGPSGDNYTYDYTKQSVDGAVTIGSNTVVLDSATDFVDGDNVGVYQTDGTMLWTTATKAGNTLTLATTTTAAVDDGATVYFYTTKEDSPEGLVECSLRNDSENDRPIDLMSRKEWSELSNKGYDGSVTQVFYQERVAAPNLFVWPQSSDSRDLLVFWVKRVREDFDAAADNPDFPQRWYFPLAYNLAVAIGPKFGSPATNKNFTEVKEQAVVWYEKAQDYDSQAEATVQFQPDIGL